jgi:acyl-coenzyme A synthetase/AMP-(fatty) acid ligase
MLMNNYGMTEILISNCVPGRIYANETTTGSVRFSVTVKIVDDDGNKLGPGETGEIYAKNLFPILVRHFYFIFLCLFNFYVLRRATTTIQRLI